MATSFSAGDVLEHVSLNNMIIAANGDGVLEDPGTTSLAVVAQSPTTMGVQASIGKSRIDGTIYSESSAVNKTIEASHATLYRKDLISYDPTTSNPVVTKGVNAAGGASTPAYPPDIPAGDILLAIVKVDAAATVIVTADITDSRIFVEPGWTYSGTGVYDGDMPLSFTDLNLSSVVGSNRAIVLLKVTSPDSSDRTFAFRPNGDTDQYWRNIGASSYPTPSNFSVGNNMATLVIVQTDGSGIIEWRGTTAVNATITVMSYCKLTSA